MRNSNSDNSGCFWLFLIGLVIAIIVNMCNRSDSSSKVSEKDKTTSQSTSSSNYHFMDELSEEDKQYENNSLATGTAPYTQFYGKNYQCPYEQCSGIKVTAPAESDIVVIIKRNNQDGKVVSHGYIRAGGTCMFPIPDGTYQTFFYYGEGWNPNKDMGNGIKGGFVKNELFSKDNPQDIYSGILTYVLQLQRNGNFQTRGSSRNEVF